MCVCVCVCVCVCTNVPHTQTLISKCPDPNMKGRITLITKFMGLE